MTKPTNKERARALQRECDMRRVDHLEACRRIDERDARIAALEVALEKADRIVPLWEEWTEFSQSPRAWEQRGDAHHEEMEGALEDYQIVRGGLVKT